MLDATQYPDEMSEREKELIKARRDIVGVPNDTSAVGLALSGGGIRSATFSLGLLQSLASHSLLERIDYLSTVSGGGYIGSSLGALYARPSLPSGWEPPPDPALPETRSRSRAVHSLLSNLQSPFIRWLRENGRYLSPNGAGSLLLAGAVMVRNWVAVQAVLGLAILCVFLTLAFVRSTVANFAPSDSQVTGFVARGFLWLGVWWSPWLAVPAGLLALWPLPVGWAYWLVPSFKLEELRKNRGNGAKETAERPVWPVVVLFALQLYAFRASLLRVDHMPVVGTPLFIAQAICLLVTGLTLVWYWTVTRIYGPRKHGAGIEDPAERRALRRNRLSSWLMNGLIMTFACLAIALADSLGQVVYAFWDSGASWGTPAAGVAAAVGAIVSMGSRFLSWFPSLSADFRPRFSVSFTAGVAAFALAAILIVAVSTLAQAIAWYFAPPPSAVHGAYVYRWCYGIQPEPCDPVEFVIPAAAGAVPDHVRWIVVALFTVLALGLTIAISRTWSFLNQSSHASIYTARLRRAYLGASNPQRAEKSDSSLELEMEDDDLALGIYLGETRGGPLHIINVTVNETVEGSSQIEQRDRKGTCLAFGPGGLSLGVRHHALWHTSLTRGWFSAGLMPVESARDDYPVFASESAGEPFKPEDLSVSRLVAISGAAVSTGLGARTSLGISVLLGLLNVRLGHWWWSGVRPEYRHPTHYKWKAVTLVASAGRAIMRGIPVQRHLIDELLARFPGTARDAWYLTDGGHFENSACYELLRRRVPFIIVSDNGEDADRLLSDLGQLIRKARLDFDCEIRSVSPEELDSKLHPRLRRYIGTFSDLGAVTLPDQSKDAAKSRALGGGANAYAALAVAAHANGERSLILWIKPGLMRIDPKDGVTPPRDIVEYAIAHASFPQESTGDQFFDEAQWESYRRLGQWIGDLLFAPHDDPDPARWAPRSLDAAAFLR